MWVVRKSLSNLQTTLSGFDPFLSSPFILCSSLFKDGGIVLLTSSRKRVSHDSRTPSRLLGNERYPGTTTSNLREASISL